MFERNNNHYLLLKSSVLTYLLRNGNFRLKKMSIHEHEEDIDVVSSPEPSPRPSSECRTSTPTFNARSPFVQDQSSLSPSKMESSPSDHGKTTNANFTSFSINSILSRNETKKDEHINGSFPIEHGTAAHDAAMMSR